MTSRHINELLINAYCSVFLTLIIVSLLWSSFLFLVCISGGKQAVLVVFLDTKMHKCTFGVTCACWPLTSQLCRFTTPVPHLAVYSGISDPPSASPSLPFLTQTPACPSPISVALDSTSASERRAEASDGVEKPEAPATPVGGKTTRSRMPLSLRRLLKRGCTTSTAFASLSPKCPSAGGTSGRIQPISPDQPSQAPPRRLAKCVRGTNRCAKSQKFCTSKSSAEQIKIGNIGIKYISRIPNLIIIHYVMMMYRIWITNTAQNVIHLNATLEMRMICKFSLLQATLTKLIHQSFSIGYSSSSQKIRIQRSVVIFSRLKLPV